MHCTATVKDMMNRTLPPMGFHEVAPDPSTSAALAKVGHTAPFRLAVGREWL